MRKIDKTRMINWLMVAAFFYAVAYAMFSAEVSGPFQTLFWKLGHVTLGGYVGYRLDRAAFRDRITPLTPPLLMIRRAIVMVGAMYVLGMGM
ncbi:MAG: putative holin [Pseudomonadota bacterium]|nr:putative holin [Pseudomonadota bacterium]